MCGKFGDMKISYLYDWYEDEGQITGEALLQCEKCGSIGFLAGVSLPWISGTLVKIVSHDCWQLIGFAFKVVKEYHIRDLERVGTKSCLR
jgi:hypothetical protein